jgi:predicted adenine nucleotide alpha hydrolase (AANH) superfamily ATPase
MYISSSVSQTGRSAVANEVDCRIHIIHRSGGFIKYLHNSTPLEHHHFFYQEESHHHQEYQNRPVNRKNQHRTFMSKRGLSAEEKQKRTLEFFHENVRS